MIVFFTIASAVWILAHVYVGWRLIGPLAPSKRQKLALWSGWGLLAAIIPITTLIRYLGVDGEAAVPFNLVSYLYMGVFLLLFVGSLLRDLGWTSLLGIDRLLVRLGGPREEGDPKHGVILPADPSRRAFVQNVVNVGIIGSVGTMTALGYREAMKEVAVNKVKVPVKGLPADLEGFTIAQISDVHIGPTLRGDFLEGVVETLHSLDADMIAVTGDLIDGYVPDLAPEVASLGTLKARHGVFFVHGNHEYYWDAPAWDKHLTSLGLTVLNNANRTLRIGSSSLMVAGVTDYRAGSKVEGHTSDPHKAFEGGAKADFRLLLAHQPKSAYEAAKAGFDLQLSGHTHGGQFYPWNFFAGLVHHFPAGLTTLDDLKVFVSRGTGYWGPPLRLGAPSEITLLTLRRA